MSGWGKAHTNNTVGFGQGSNNNTFGWGSIYKDTESGETDLEKIIESQILTTNNQALTVNDKVVTL